MKQKDTFKILVVEDDADDQFFIHGGIMAVNSDIQIIPVYNGVQAMDYLLNKGSYKDILSGRPHIIITDLNMPMCTGLELLALLKIYNDFKDIPVFVLSTCNKEDTKTTCLELGALKYFPKPNFSGLYTGIIKEMLLDAGYNSRILLSSREHN